MEKEMQEAGLDHDAIRKRRQEEPYKIIQEFENWRTHSEESLQKRALTSYYLATGRYYLSNDG